MQLPRLLYLADVPVASTYAGSMLVYRMLQSYPADRQRIVQSNLWREAAGASHQRIPGVSYRSLYLGPSRLLSTRFSRLFAHWLQTTAEIQRLRLARLVSDYSPDVVCTVSHGYTWITAAALCRRHRLPLVLICHDDWPTIGPASKRLRTRVASRFGHVYRQAKSRLCVSPGMAEEYQRRYAASGTVLYPARSLDAVAFAEPSPRVRHARGPFTVAFAGSLGLRGYRESLARLASVLDSVSGRLIIYSSLDAATSTASGLRRSNVDSRPMIPAEELVTRLRDEADLLYVPLLFDGGAKMHMMTAFPSKLTEYTATGIPILIHGPEYAAAVQWGRSHPGSAAIVTSEQPEAMRREIDKLASDAEYRQSLACGALEAGDADFSPDAARDTFLDVLRKIT